MNGHLSIISGCAKVKAVCQNEPINPKKRHRARVHGFIKRMASKAGRAVLKRRRLKGRARLSH